MGPRPEDWKAYAKSLIVFSLAAWLPLYFILPTQTLWNWDGPEPGGVPLGPVERHVQHHLVVRHQHELAVLQRRDHDELLQPDGRAHRGERPVRWGGHRGGVALIRGIIGRSGKSLGNLWFDLIRPVRWGLTTHLY